MSKRCYRFFGGLLTAQEHWLNKMSEKGYRLIRTEKMLYEFEACKPDQVKYCVEFIGQKFILQCFSPPSVCCEQEQQSSTNYYCYNRG